MVTITIKQGLKLAEIARTWVGTPHRNAHKEKGVAVDCARLLEGVVEDAKLAPVGFADVTGSYTNDWFLNKGENIMIPFFDRFCEKIPVNQKRSGDFLLFTIGRQVGHCAIMIDSETVIHSIPNIGVCIASLENDYHFFDKKGNSRLTYVYRLRRGIA